MRKNHLNLKTNWHLLKGIFYRKKRYPKSTDDETLSSIPGMLRHYNSTDDLFLNLNSITRESISLPPLMSVRNSSQPLIDRKFNKFEFETQNTAEEALRDIDIFEQ